MDTACVSWNSDATTRLHLVLILSMRIAVRQFLRMPPWRPRGLFTILCVMRCHHSILATGWSCESNVINFVFETRYQLSRRIFTSSCVCVCVCILQYFVLCFIFQEICHLTFDFPPEHFPLFPLPTVVTEGLNLFSKMKSSSYPYAWWHEKLWGLCIAACILYFYRLIFLEITPFLFDKRLCGPHNRSGEQTIFVPAWHRACPSLTSSPQSSLCTEWAVGFHIKKIF